MSDHFRKKTKCGILIREFHEEQEKMLEQKLNEVAKKLKAKTDVKAGKYIYLLGDCRNHLRELISALEFLIGF